MSRPAFFGTLFAIIGMVALYVFGFIGSIINADENALTMADARGKANSVTVKNVMFESLDIAQSIAGLYYSGLVSQPTLQWTSNQAVQAWTVMARYCDGQARTANLMFGITGVDGSYFSLHCANNVNTVGSTVAWVSQIVPQTGDAYHRSYYSVSSTTPVSYSLISKSVSNFNTVNRAWYQLAKNLARPTFESPLRVSTSTGTLEDAALVPMYDSFGSFVGVAACFVEAPSFNATLANIGPNVIVVDRQVGSVLFSSTEPNTFADGTVKVFANMSSKFNNADVLNLMSTNTNGTGSTKRIVNDQGISYISVYDINMYPGNNINNVGQYGPGAMTLDYVVITITDSVAVNAESSRPRALLIAGGAVVVVFAILIFLIIRCCTPAAHRQANEYEKAIN